MMLLPLYAKSEDTIGIEYDELLLLLPQPVWFATYL